MLEEESGGEGNREKRGGRQEGQWKGRNREKCFQWAGLLPDLLHCVHPAGDQRKVVGTWRENEDSEKVLGHADLSTSLNWRGSFLLIAHDHVHYTGFMPTKKPEGTPLPAFPSCDPLIPTGVLCTPSPSTQFRLAIKIGETTLYLGCLLPL